MSTDSTPAAGTDEAPGGHTPEGGVLRGAEDAPHRLVVFEDAQCPYCREFEQASAGLLEEEVAAGRLAVEHRMRAFLGPESVRAANALALAAEEGRFEELRTALFADQPQEGTGGFTADDLVAAGERVGLTGERYAAGVREEVWSGWVLAAEDRFAQQDPDGTPMLYLDGEQVDPRLVYDREALAGVLRPDAA